MLIREVIELAVRLLDREDLLNAVASGEAQGEVATLLRCYHVVENEVALDYFPIFNTEKFAVKDGKLFFTQFTLTPVNVKKVTNTSDMGVPFSVNSLYLSLPESCREVLVTYSYSPPKQEMDGIVPFPNTISPRLLAFGVASEYCIIARRFEEGKMWGERYRDALRAAGILRRPLSVRSRRWV